MSLRDKFDTDEKLEAEGVWQIMGYNDDATTIEFLLARRGGANKDFDVALELATRPHRAAIDAGKLPSKLGLQISKKVFSETVIKDWRGVQASEFGDVDTKELVNFTPAKALELFNLMPELYYEANTKAMALQNYLRQKREDQAKNL